MNFNTKTLIVAAHPDDEVLGCGGTIAKIVANGGAVQTIFLADGESSRFPITDIHSRRVKEKIAARRDAANAAAKIVGSEPPKFYDFPDNRLDTIALLDISKIIEEEITAFSPQRVITHFAGDLNRDHQIVLEAVMIATRPVLKSCVNEVISFEIPSSTEWGPVGVGLQFSPNLFVSVDEFVNLKFAALDAYEVEMRNFPHPRSKEAIEALMKWRGATVGTKSAESFMVERILV